MELMVAGKRAWLRIVCAGLALAGLFWLEPWAPRFEGRTVEAWLKVFRQKREIDQRVVDGFGPKIARRLERAIAREIRLARFRNISEELLEVVVRHMEFDDRDGQELAIAAGSWLSWLAAKGYHLETEARPAVSHWMDCWDDSFWAPRWVQLVLTTPEESKAAKAAAAQTNNFN